MRSRVSVGSRRYIDQSRAIGAKPVLATPRYRRTFTKDGKLKDALVPYANAMKEVAAEMEVPRVNLNTESLKFFEKLGPAESDKLANKPDDHTHFTEKGAKAMVQLVMDELPSAEPSLKKHLKEP